MPIQIRYYHMFRILLNGSSDNGFSRDKFKGGKSPGNLCVNVRRPLQGFGKEASDRLLQPATSISICIFVYCIY